MIKPQKVTGIDAVFGRVEGLLPPVEEIPKEFFKMNNKWHKLVSTWFFEGLGKVKFIPKDEINKEDALGHIRAILKSFEPKHEHKIAGCAYLLSEFFEDVTVK